MSSRPYTLSAVLGPPRNRRGGSTAAGAGASAPHVPAALVGKAGAREPWMVALYSDEARLAAIRSRTPADLLTMGQMFRVMAVDPAVDATAVFQRVVSIWRTVALLGTMLAAFSAGALFALHDLQPRDARRREYLGCTCVTALFLGIMAAVSAATAAMLYTVALQEWKRRFLVSIAWAGQFPLYLFATGTVAFTATALLYLAEVFDGAVLRLAAALEAALLGMCVAAFLATAAFWERIVGLPPREAARQ